MDHERNYHDFLRLVQSRRSVRRFLDQPLSPETIEKLVEAARWAPSAGNRQAFRFLVVTSRPTIERMAAAVRQANLRRQPEFRADLAEKLQSYVRQFEHFGGAPVVIVPIYRIGVDLLAPDRVGDDPSDGPPRLLVDALSSVAAATLNLLLAAHALGLGACWMTGPLVAAAALGAELRVPAGWHIAALVPVGLPDEVPTPPRRREPGRLVRTIE